MVIHSVDEEEEVDDENDVVDGMKPTLDKINAIAMAVTGAPRSLPTNVFFPKS